MTGKQHSGPPELSGNEIVPKRKIVVIDDDAMIRSFIEYILKQQRYEVVMANNAGDGYDAIIRESPDLIVSDILLPGMNGYDLCHKIKSNPALQHIPIILITAVYKELSFKMEARKIGADDFIEKPFAKEDFLDRVERLLPTGFDSTAVEIRLPDDLPDFEPAVKPGSRGGTLESLPLQIEFANSDNFLTTEMLGSGMMDDPPGRGSDFAELFPLRPEDDNSGSAVQKNPSVSLDPVIRLTEIKKSEVLKQSKPVRKDSGDSAVQKELDDLFKSARKK
jgi:CheY-like chemotaxis protein